MQTKINMTEDLIGILEFRWFLRSEESPEKNLEAQEITNKQLYLTYTPSLVVKKSSSKT